MSSISMQTALIVLFLIYIATRVLGLSPLASIFNLIVGVSCAGLALQIMNHNVTTWDSSIIVWMTVGGVLLQFVLVLFCRRHLPIKTHRVMRLIKSVVELLLFLVVTVIVLLSCRTVAFNQMIFAEDNAKWTNAAFFVNEGSTSSLVVNGVGGALFSYLSVVIALLAAISQLLNLDLPRTTLVVLGVWFAGVTILGLSVSLLWSGLKRTLQPGRRFSLLNSVVVIGISLSCVLLLIESQTFGFLTLIFSLVLTGLSAREAFGEEESGPLNFFFALVLSLNAAFVWLPLTAVLGPVVFLFLLLLIRATWTKSRTAAVGVMAGSILLGYPMLSDRVEYLLSTTSSESSTWRELLKSPGATPSVTISVLVAGMILLFVVVEIQEMRVKLLYAMPALGISLLGVVQITASSLDGDTRYTIQKLGVFTFVAVILGVTQVRTSATSVSKSVSLPTASLTCVALLVFGGDLMRVSTRIFDTATYKTLTDQNRYWIKEASNRLSTGDTLPVGCVSVTEAGAISSDFQKDYFCTRALGGIAGGEERLIGLLAHSMGTFNADEMIGSLTFYLGQDSRETVMLLAPDGTVSEVVPVSELGNRLPDLFDPASP